MVDKNHDCDDYYRPQDEDDEHWPNEEMDLDGDYESRVICGHIREQADEAKF